jgi:hypothetical protein
LDKYYLVLATLSEFQVAKVMAVMEEEPDEESYNKIKDALLATHTLTPFQQVDKLVNMEGLGGRKPSELLTEMDKFKPKDMHSFYAYHFLQQMPQEVQVLLAREDSSNMSLHLPQQHDVIAAVQHDADTVTAISGKNGGKKGNRNKKKQKKQRNHSISPSTLGQVAAVLGAHPVRRQSLQLCEAVCLAGKLGGLDECNSIRPGNLSMLATAAASGSSEAPSAAASSCRISCPGENF